MNDASDSSSAADGLELPESWRVIRVSEICRLNPGATFEGLSDDDLVTFLPMPAVDAGSGRIDVSDQRPLTMVRKGYTRFREGDVLFAKITPSMENGKVAVARGLKNGFGCGSTEFHVLRPEHGISPDFIFYFLVQDGFREVARRNMKGTAGQLRVPPEFLANALISCPPAPEQSRIVAKLNELFSRIEKGEENLKRVQALVMQYRQSVLKAAVTGELTRDWRDRNADRGETGEQLLQRILKARRAAWESAELEKMKAKGKTPKDDKWKRKYKEPEPPDVSELPELPDSWVWATPQELASPVSNALAIGPFGSNLKVSDYRTSGVPLIFVRHIRTENFDGLDPKYVSEKKFEGLTPH